jgi:repressor LexA
MMDDLTTTQQQIWGYIKDCTLDRGYPPTLREIGDHFQIASTNGVRYHLRILVRKGYLERPRGMRRGLRLTWPDGSNAYVPADTVADSDFQPHQELLQLQPDGQPHAVTVPIIGRIAAGEPILAQENREAEICLDPALFGSPSVQLFGLRVQGDSMIGAGILDDDIAIVRSQREAHPGEIIAALVDGDATVKRFRPRGQEIWLEPQNLSYRPIKVTANQEFSIAGIVVGIIRNRVL